MCVMVELVQIGRMAVKGNLEFASEGLFVAKTNLVLKALECLSGLCVGLTLLQLKNALTTGNSCD